MANYQPTYLGEIELSEETLAHYGVKGMKWRHRRGKKPVSSKKKDWNYLGKAQQARAHKLGVLKDIGDKGRQRAGWEQNDNGSRNDVARTKEERTAMEAMYQNAHSERNNLGYESVVINGERIWRPKKKK